MNSLITLNFSFRQHCSGKLKGSSRRGKVRPQRHAQEKLLIENFSSLFVLYWSQSKICLPLSQSEPHTHAAAVVGTFELFIGLAWIFQLLISSLSGFSRSRSFSKAFRDSHGLQLLLEALKMQRIAAAVLCHSTNWKKSNRKAFKAGNILLSFPETRLFVFVTQFPFKTRFKVSISLQFIPPALTIDADNSRCWKYCSRQINIGAALKIYPVFKAPTSC